MTPEMLLRLARATAAQEDHPQDLEALAAWRYANDYPSAKPLALRRYEGFTRKQVA